MTDTTTTLVALIESLRRPHYINDEDCWYSCPKAKSDWSEGSASCNDEPKDKCTCGADTHNAKVDALLAVFSDPASIHLNILRGIIPLSRMNALHIAGATDYDTLLAEVRQRREADVDPMVAVKAYEAAHGGRSFTFRRGPNIFSWSGATAQEAWANAGMPAEEFGTWSWYEIGHEVEP